MISVTPRALTWTPALLPVTLVAALLILSGCGTQSETQAPPAESATGFEFYVDPQTEQITLTETTGKAEVQPQATPSDSRILVPNVDVGITNFSATFEKPKKLVVYFRLKNLTPDSNFAQPFFFTLSSTSKNLEQVNIALVTNAQLGLDGVLSPGEASQRVRLEAYFKENEPFTFLANINAVVPNAANPSPVCTNPVAIPDANLEGELRYEFDKPSGDFTCADLESLTTFRSGLVYDLGGLQYAVNLTFLDLGVGGISDLSPLQNLTNLKQLFLYGNNISDLSPLQNLTGLDVLNLDNNRISDLSPLQKLTNLKRLSLSQNPIYDLAPLQKLTGLTYLNLEETGISDISALVSNSGLGSGDRVLLKSNIFGPQVVDDIETLIARGVEVEFNAPTGCTNPVIIPDEGLELGIREARGKPSGDLTCADLESLRYFRASYRSVTNLEGLQYAVKMKELRLRVNTISDLTPLQNLTNLTNLDLRDNNISDVSALVANSGLDAGDSLRIEGNPLSSQALDDIETLEARGVDVTF